MSLPKPAVKQVKSSWIGAAIEPDMKRQLSQYAKKHKISKSEAVRFIIGYFFDSDFQNSKVEAGLKEVSLEENR